MAKEKEEFVVADRRKFTSEGELRPDAPVETASEPSESPRAVKESSKPDVAGEDSKAAAENDASETMPPPPTAAEQTAQHRDYHAASNKIDSILENAGQKRTPQMDVTFERLIVSLYMQSMAQLGMIREEGSEPQPDLIGARQTIDTIALLGEKTKGNLTERESTMLQNCLFELRMAFLEITNALTTPGAGPAPPKK
jgi:hypothetical protein